MGDQERQQNPVLLGNAWDHTEQLQGGISGTRLFIVWPLVPRGGTVESHCVQEKGLEYLGAIQK